MVIPMVKKYRIPAVIIILLLSVLFLSGCGAQTQTQMAVSDALAGNRVMHCTVSRQDVQNKLSGGEQALDELISLHCPAQLSWEKSSGGRDLTYTFTLAFTGREDYRQKAEALLGRRPSVVFAVPNSPFVQGFRLKEDFTSADLLAWLGTAAVQQGLVAENTSFFSTDTGATVQYQGQAVSTGSQIDINRTQYLPVDKITIATNILTDRTFRRTVVFQIPQSTYDAADGLTEYMKKRVPAGGTGSWNSIASGKTFTVSFTAKTANDLALFTAAALDGKSSAGLTNTSRSLFGSQLGLTEELDFSSFASGKNGKTFVEYLCSTGTSGISAAELFNKGKWTDVSGYTSGSDFSYSGDMDSLQVRLSGENDYPLDDISIFMTQQPQGTFNRQIQFTFNEKNGVPGAQKAKAYFESLNAPDAAVTAENNVCTLSLSGSAEKISNALGILFGDGNSVRLTESKGFRLYHTSAVEENINLEPFAQETGFAARPIHYRFTAPRNISSFTQQNGGGEIKNLSSQGNEIALTISGQSNLIGSCSRLNGWFVAALLGLGVLAACIIAFLICGTVNLLRGRRAKVTIVPAAAPVTFIPLKKHCSACGEQLYKGMRYCTKCGAPLTFFAGIKKL